MTTRVLGQKGAEAFETRKISLETIVRFGIYTASRVEVSHDVWETLPDPNGNVIAFPYGEHDVIVNEKYRRLPWDVDDGKTRFWQTDGGKRTFWNADVLDDPALAEGTYPLTITEGEIDAATAIDCGFPFTVSVPDGAPPVPKGRAPDDLDPLDPGAQQTGKFEFLWNNRERLKTIKRFCIAVDNDAPGQRLGAELVRRLSAARCTFVTYPPDEIVRDRKTGDMRGCKDLNEVRVHLGPQAVAAVLNSARPYPIRGIYRLADYPDLPPLPTFRTGWDTLDEILRLFAGEFMVVTGVPGHGKSTWVLNLLRNLNEIHGWRAAIFSPEMQTVPHLRDKLRNIKIGRPADPLDRDAIGYADEWINDAITFIDDDPAGDGEQELTLDWLLDRASDAVLRDGIRLLVIDPWNEIEHAKKKDESMGEYIGRAIRTMRRWSKPRGVATIVIAHPTKDVGKEGKVRVPTLYDIDGSAHWYNKPDHGVVVHADNAASQSTVYVKKVRFDGTGEKGSVKFKFNKSAQSYGTLDGSRGEGDLSNG